MKRTFAIGFLLLCVLTIISSGQVRPKRTSPTKAPLGTWALWGGPQRDFITGATGLFSKTGEKWISTPPKKVWERPLGDGYSGIAAENGILYTAFRRGSDDVVTALDSASGATKWEFSYSAPFTNAYPDGAGPGPYSMPQVIGDRVVSVSGIGQVNSIDKTTGKVVWSMDLYRDFAGDRLPFGYSSHPLPYKDSLIILAGGKTHGVLKVRQSDGAVVWSKHRLAGAHSSPLLINVDGQAQVVLLLAQEIIGIEPEGGELLWRHPHATENGLAISTPVWADGNLLFVSSAYNGGARVLKLTQSGGRTQVQELWHDKRIQSHFGTVIRRGAFVYLSSGQSVGLMTAVDLQTGRIAWQARDFVKAQLLYADNRLIILDQDGNLGIGVASPEKFQAVARWPLLSAISWSPPTLVGNRLYMRDRKVIMALEF